MRLFIRGNRINLLAQSNLISRCLGDCLVGSANFLAIGLALDNHGGSAD